MDKHIVPFKIGNTADIAFILPGMPGLVDGYYELAGKLKEDSVYGIHLPGFDGGEPLTNIPAISEHFAALIASVKPKGTIKLYAHSYGGLIMYDLLRRLSKTELKVTQAVLLDGYANLLELDAKERKFLIIYLVAMEFSLTTTKKEIRSIATKMENLSTTEEADFLYDLISQSGKKVDRKFFVKIFNMYNTYMNIEYKMEEQLKTELILVKAKDNQALKQYPALGWTNRYKSIKIVHSKGTHMEVIKSDFVDNWMAKIKS